MLLKAAGIVSTYLSIKDFLKGTSQVDITQMCIHFFTYIKNEYRFV